MCFTGFRMMVPTKGVNGWLIHYAYGLDLYNRLYYLKLFINGNFVKINCDLGEGFGRYQLCDTNAIMPYIDQANIACGMHAGDPVETIHTLKLAKQHNVTIGAHPSYPDRQGFGRRHMRMSVSELADCITYQIALLLGLCQRYDCTLSYVKPHGALYHDMVSDAQIRKTLFQVIKDFEQDLSCMVPAFIKSNEMVEDAEQVGLNLQFEAFADRAYHNTGELVGRSQPNSVLTLIEAQAQAKNVANRLPVTTVEGDELLLHADTLCVHSDTPNALELIQAVYCACR